MLLTPKRPTRSNSNIVSPKFGDSKLVNNNNYISTEDLFKSSRHNVIVSGMVNKKTNDPINLEDVLKNR
jgi:hypothetical protein